MSAKFVKGIGIVKKLDDVPKILMVKKEVANEEWCKHLPTPLKEGEKVVVKATRMDSLFNMGIQVKHGNGIKGLSWFHHTHFADVFGHQLKIILGELYILIKAKRIVK